MAQIDGMLLEIDSYTKNANLVKDAILSRLINDNIITEDQGIEYSEKWQVIIIKKNWFTRWRDKYLKSDDEGYLFKYVRFED